MALSIDQIPIPVPSSTDPANFSARGDAVFGAFPDFITQTNAVASEAAVNRDSAEASKIAAANSETNAATYAANATTSANNASSSSVAPLWVSGTTYAINDKRVSPITGQVYRRKTVGAGTTDPSLDSTNWYAVLLDADTQYPSIKPTLNLDFANSGKLDPRITFTRASTATYYDGKTFAKAEENLLLYSQDFDNAVWGKFDSIITANAIAAPSGSVAADLVIPTTSNATHGVFQSFSYTATSSVISAYVKAGGYNRVQLYMSEGGPAGFVTFDLVSATVTHTVNGGGVTGVSATISSIGNGWFRIAMSGSAPVAINVAGILILDSAANGSSLGPSFAGNGTSGIYIWGAQLEQRSSVTAYTPTTSQPITKYQPVLKTASNNEPRFDYDPVTLEAKGLLIEEQRTNLLLRSQQFEAADWVRAYMTVLSDSIVAPDGSLAADFFVSDTSSNAKSTHQAVTVTSGVSYSLSVYAKAAGIDYVILRYQATNFPSVAIRFDLTSGMTSTVSGYTAPTSFGATYIGNGWYRLTITSTATGSGLGYPTISLSKDTTSYAYTGDGASGIYIWGAQLEQGSFPTSYIPTTTTAVTRQADNAVMTGTNFSSWYKQGEGTIYAESQWGGEQPAGTVIAIEGASANRMRLAEVPSSTEVLVQSTGIGVVASSASGSKRKSIFSFKNSDLVLTANGSTPVTNPDPIASPIVTYLAIGSSPTDGAAFKWNGTIKRITYYPKRLPNYQLQILTK